MMILVGGGWYHPTIRLSLQQLIEAQYGTSIRIASGDNIGWSLQYLEAELMAFLAVRCLNHQPITFPLTTRVFSPLLGRNFFYPSIGL